MIERIKTITQHTIHKQIQDYYVIMKLNDRTKSTMALYRLFLVSYMLRNIKIPGMGTPHDYPKMMLCQILMMVYWLSCGLPVWKVMEHNICVFNEEMGETYYSILARCVLGDNIKSDFDHMNKIFSLLPLYKNVKDDISNDVNNKAFSHTWHHNIPVDAEEVTATVFFFKRLINDVVDGKYRSYAYSDKYPTIGTCIATRTTGYVPLVYRTDLSLEVTQLATKIRTAISTDFMTPFVNDWPFNPIPDGGRMRRESKSAEDDEEKKHDGGGMDDDDENESDNDNNWVEGPPWNECEVGKFAVIRCEIGTPSKFGICVVKVVQKDQEILTDVFPKRKLYGKEYLCTQSNIELRCVRGGKWNWHNTRSTIDEYDNFNVIMYFDRLIDGALPLSVMQTIEHVHSTKRIFF